MATDNASSVQGLALRVCQLDVDGSPLTGTTTCYKTEAFMTFGFSAEYAEGDEIEEKAANGLVCVYYQMPDTLKRAALTLTICAPQPELYQLLAGGTLLTEGGGGTDAVGYAAPVGGTEANPNGIGIEVWSRAIVNGKPAATNPYWRWVFPYAKLKFSGDRVLENGMMANEFEGFALGNSGFGTGPALDWDYSSSSSFQYARDSAFPTGEGYVAVA